MSYTFETIGNGIIFKGDCLEVLKELPDNFIDMVLTSPTYDNLRNYNNTCNWNFDIFKNIAKELYRVIKQGGVLVCVVGDSTINGSESGTSFKQALYFKELGFNIHDTMIKGNIFEYRTGSTQTGKIKHPAMFPLDLANDQIKSWSNENDIVLDCFMGSGTTCVACKELNRKFIGIELDKSYYEIAKQRIEEV